MNKEYKIKFPEWCDDSVNYYDLALSDDIDSLLSCIYLEHLKGYHINYFFNFNAMGRIENIKNKAIAVDIDVCKGRAWGNHVTLLNKNDTINESCANLNVVDRISRENYFSKYCGSTLLTILSYYDIDISKYSEEAKMILLAIDVTFKGYYSTQWEIFRNRNKYYLCDVLEFPELYELQQKYTDKDFYDIITKYNLHEHIITKNGYLHTKINLAELSEVFLMPIELPEGKFNLMQEFDNKNKRMIKNNCSKSKKDINDDIFSLAVAGRDYIMYSTKR